LLRPYDVGPTLLEVPDGLFETIEVPGRWKTGCCSPRPNGTGPGGVGISRAKALVGILVSE
jgi:hypothetical protein